MRLGILIGCVALFIVAAAAGYFYLQKENMISTSTKVAKPTQATVFGSIQEALSSNLSLKCDYVNGDIHTVAYIKKGQIRSDITNVKNASMSGSVLMMGQKIYYWNAEKTGFVMAMPSITPTLSVTPTEVQSGNGQNTISDLEKYKQYCHTSVVADNLFALPTDVKFTDETQMMHMMPSVAVTVPPSGANYQQQAQKYMQQYHITPPQQ